MLARSTEYGIRALVYVRLQNWQEKRPGVNEIAREIEAPVAYSAKILHILTTHQLLGSQKGRGGGFFFPDDAPELTLHRVILTMEGDRLFTKCGFGLKHCNDANPCPLHDQYANIRDDILTLAKTETIGSLASKIRDGTAYLNRQFHIDGFTKPDEV